MDDKGGKDWQSTKMNGVEGVVEYIDSIGQIHLKGRTMTDKLDFYPITNFINDEDEVDYDKIQELTDKYIFVR